MIWIYVGSIDTRFVGTEQGTYEENCITSSSEEFLSFGLKYVIKQSKGNTINVTIGEKFSSECVRHVGRTTLLVKNVYYLFRLSIRRQIMEAFT